MNLDDSMHRDADAENKIRDKANDPTLTVRARQWSIYGPIVLAAFLAVATTLGGFLGNRVVNNYDGLSAKVDSIKDLFNSNNAIMQKNISDIQGQVNIIVQHASDTNNVLNERVNAVSASTRENRENIDRLKDQIYRNGQK